MEKMKTPSGEQKLKDEQAAKQAVEKSRRPVPAVSDYQEPDYSLLPKGAHAKLPMIQDNSPVSATADGQSDTPQTYTVKPGDSLSKILGTSDPAAIGAFMRENGLDSSTIQPGQKLTLPSGSYQASDAALGQATLNVDNTKRVAARSSLPDGWNMLDASAASREANTARLAGDTAKLVAAQQANSPSARAGDGTNGVDPGTRLLNTMDSISRSPFGTAAYLFATASGYSENDASTIAFLGATAGDLLSLRGGKVTSKFDLPRLDLTRDAFSIKATVLGDAKAYFRAELPSNGVVEVTDIFRGELPKGSGGEFVAQALKGHGEHEVNQLVFKGIMNEPTIASYKSGADPATSVLGITGTRAIESLGKVPTAYNFEIVRGKLNLIIDTK